MPDVEEDEDEDEPSEEDIVDEEEDEEDEDEDEDDSAEEDTEDEEVETEPRLKARLNGRRIPEVDVLSRSPSRDRYAYRRRERFRPPPLSEDHYRPPSSRRFVAQC